MDELFSDRAPQQSSSPPNLGAREAEVRVPADQEQAFEGFTELIHLWWPLAEYSAFGAESHLGFEGQSLVEEALDGRQYLWATVRDWQPAAALRLEFYLGDDPATPTRLSVSFEAAEKGTLVRLIHDGWATGARGAAQYQKYSEWPLILGRYARFMGGVG
ncbi:hypothetical protein [Psychromicrobium lacuslunae]|uniref:ATPase n=1 Tax=Psychromicrobium lacuslunae TaxID=1618207 RepID=A0A0D4BWF8_9MICC|nr:hypothetical protein [Psychromicrobium lacuslunae]AJT40643.1 hypothetical protein UM93_02245 [Psychromicrobium lacuslunae]